MSAIQYLKDNGYAILGIEQSWLAEEYLEDGTWDEANNEPKDALWDKLDEYNLNRLEYLRPDSTLNLIDSSESDILKYVDDELNVDDGIDRLLDKLGKMTDVTKDRLLKLVKLSAMYYRAKLVEENKFDEIRYTIFNGISSSQWDDKYQRNIDQAISVGTSDDVLDMYKYIAIKQGELDIFKVRDMLNSGSNFKGFIELDNEVHEIGGLFQNEVAAGLDPLLKYLANVDLF
ncbi:hypothetical protein BX667DRAFT_520225 [Coemansia mojavensis]|nr:hypothetical protein BX667DRAFT_520225 [Coemansia mojavensis]